MKLSVEAKRMVGVVLIVGLLGSIAGLAYYRSVKALPYLLGLGLGSVASLIRVILLERTVNKVIYENKSKGIVQMSHLGRLAIAFIAMLMGALVEGISLVGVIVGVFSYQLASYSLGAGLMGKSSLKSKIVVNEEKED